MTRAALALGAALALVACGDPPPSFDLSGAREVQLTLTTGETVSLRGRSSAKEIRVFLRGAPRPASAGGDDVVRPIDLAVVWAELTYVGADGARVVLATDGSREDPVLSDSLTRARRGLLEGLVGAPVALTPVVGAGVPRVEGLRAALSAAADALAESDVPDDVRDAAVGGIEPLLDDAAAARALAAAGLGPAPAEMRRPGREVRRTARVHVDGRGVTVVETFGRGGEGRGGAPTVRLSGRLPDAPAWEGDPGAAPPSWTGAVRLDGVTIAAETEYVPGSLLPQRGNVVVELPYEAGHLVRRTTEFLLVVTE